MLFSALKRTADEFFSFSNFSVSLYGAKVLSTDIRIDYYFVLYMPVKEKSLFAEIDD